MQGAIFYCNKFIALCRSGRPIDYNALVEAYDIKINIYLTDKNFKQVCSTYNECIALCKKGRPIDYNALIKVYDIKVKIYLKSKNFEHACSTCDECIRLCKKQSPIDYNALIKIYDIKANIYLKSKDFEQAFSTYKALAKILPQTFVNNMISVNRFEAIPGKQEYANYFRLRALANNRENTSAFRTSGESKKILEKNKLTFKMKFKESPLTGYKNKYSIPAAMLSQRALTFETTFLSALWKLIETVKKITAVVELGKPYLKPLQTIAKLLTDFLSTPAELKHLRNFSFLSCFTDKKNCVAIINLNLRLLRETKQRLRSSVDFFDLKKAEAKYNALIEERKQMNAGSQDYVVATEEIKELCFLLFPKTGAEKAKQKAKIEKTNLVQRNLKTIDTHIQDLEKLLFSMSTNNKTIATKKLFELLKRTKNHVASQCIEMPFLDPIICAEQSFELVDTPMLELIKELNLWANKLPNITPGEKGIHEYVKQQIRKLTELFKKRRQELLQNSDN